MNIVLYGVIINISIRKGGSEMSKHKGHKKKKSVKASPLETTSAIASIIAAIIALLDWLGVKP